jgi:ATP-dependent Lon protease
MGYSYRSMFGGYLPGAKSMVIEDPYIRRDHQIRNLLHLFELAVEFGEIKSIKLITSAENDYQKEDVKKKFEEVAEDLADNGIEFTWKFDDKIHDREIRLDNGWHIQIGRGLDIYQGPMTWLKIGTTNYDLRPCMETKVNIFRK